jgi:hypothetical protein
MRGMHVRHACAARGAHRELRGRRVVGGLARARVDEVAAAAAGARAIALDAREEDAAAVVAVEPGAPVLEALDAVAVGRVDSARCLVWHGVEHTLLGAVAVVHVEVQQRNPADASVPVRAQRVCGADSHIVQQAESVASRNARAPRNHA